MASEFVVSPLSVPEQSKRLHAYALTLGSELSLQAAESVCKSLNLHKPSEKKDAGRRVVAALASHGVVIGYQRALEALAKMCGGTCWMRFRQQLAPVLDPSKPPPMYALQTVHAGRGEGTWAIKASLAEAATSLLEAVKAEWPAESAPAQCTLHIGPQAICVEFEHPTAPWLSLNIVAFNPTDGAPHDCELDHGEVREFIERVTRALEHSHPGLLVLGAIRSETLPPWYHFVPTLRQASKGHERPIAGDMDLFAVLGALDIGPMAETDTGLTLQGADGPVEVLPRWASGVDGDERDAPVSARQMRSVTTRLARIQRLCGPSMTQFFASILTGTDSAEDFHAFNAKALEDRRLALGLSVADFAERAGVSLNEMLRMQKYGWANAASLPQLASAIGVEDPNKLLSPQRDQGLGIRVARGDMFLKNLKKTHAWRLILGDGLQGEEREKVNTIAQSLQESVDLLQFSQGPFADSSLNEIEPINEEGLAVEVQTLLDDLAERGVAVIVEQDIRFMRTGGESAGLDKMLVHESTLFFEKVANLQTPGSAPAVATSAS